MAEYVRHLVRPANGLLDEDETLLAGSPCLPRGAIAKRAAGAVFGVAGNVIAGAGATSGYGVAAPPLPSLVAIGVTTKRLLIFGMGSFRGRPNKLLYAIPLSQVSRVTFREGRAVGLKKTELDVVPLAGSNIQLDIAREHMKHGRKVEEALTGLGVTTAA
jgi:hypothetical protein